MNSKNTGGDKTFWHTAFSLLFLVITFVPLSSGCTSDGSLPDPDPDPNIPQTYVLAEPDDANIIYHGRIDHSNPKAPRILWAGSGFTTFFEGTSVKLVMEGSDANNYYNVIIDDQTDARDTIRSIKGEREYKFDGLGEGIHKLQVLRRTDPTSSAGIFKGILIEEGTELLISDYQIPELKIEFYGNSITTGHGILDETRNNNDDKSTWDNYLSYASVTARELGADYRCISMSGIGILKSWYYLTMPMVYNRIDPHDDQSQWDFSLWTADIVVINLFQNDSWLLKGKTNEEIIAAYESFVSKIRTEYPDAHIFCALGNMDITRTSSKWPGLVETAVENLNTNGDQKIYSIMFPYKNTSAHPNVSEHQSMADLLVPFIRQKTGL